jgi:hypothetical protein
VSASARIGAAAAALFACLACAVPASAARTEVVRMYAFEPHLAGSAVVFRAPARAGNRIMRAAPGQAPATLTTVEREPSFDDECCSVNSASELAASDGYVAVSRWVQFFAKGAEAENSFYIRAGPATGPLETLHQCYDNHPIDVDGTLLAYTNGCTEAGGTPPVVVRDLAQQGAPAVAVIQQSSSVTDLDLAGQHLAMLRAPGGKPEIEVRDFAQPNPLYTVPADTVVQFSLQADGKLAVKQQSQSACAVKWYSKAEPTAHDVGVCPFGDVVLANDRIALERETDSVASLDLVELNGQSRSVAAFGAAGMIEGFDFDGTRVAYAVGGCVVSQNAIFVDDLTGAASPAESTACPVVFTASKVRAASSGLVRIPFVCKVGCQGSMALTRGGKSLVTGVKAVDQRPGSGRVTLRLTRSARKQLADRGELAARASLQAGQRNGIPRTYKRAIRLLAPK